MADVQRAHIHPSDYPDLDMLLGRKLFSRIITEIEKIDTSTTLTGTKKLFGECDRYIFIRQLTVTGDNAPADASIHAAHLCELIRSVAFLKLAHIYGKRTSSVLARMIRTLLEIGSVHPDQAVRCAKLLGSSDFKHFVSEMFTAVKDSLIRELMECFSLIAFSPYPETTEKFAAFICSDEYIHFMKRYARYKDELASLTRKSALLLKNFPARDEHRTFLCTIADTSSYFNWTELFCDLKYIDQQTRRVYDANEYIAWLFCYIFLLGKWNAEIMRSLSAIIHPDISEKLKGGRLGIFKGIVNLVNGAVYFCDSFIFRIYADVYCMYQTRDEVRREIFGIAADIVLSGDLKPSRRKDFLQFFLSPSYCTLVKNLRKSSVETLLFLTHVAVFSLRYETGEFFKIIDEKKLLELLLRIARRDRLYRNYLQLFTYIDRNLESRTLRMKLVVYFYFHYSQIASGKTHKAVVYLNLRHREFTEALMRRDMRAVADPWFKSKLESGTAPDLRLVFHKAAKTDSTAGEHWYIRDPDFDRAVFMLRLEVITGIMGKRSLTAEEYQACNYLLDLAGNLRLEDGLYMALPDVLQNNDLIPYYLFIRDKFMEDPFTIELYLAEGGFYRVYFREFRSFILRMLVPVTGLIPIKESEWAKTDNKNIYLPQYVHEFDDKKNPDAMYDNRNIALYIYLGLHEFSHWLADSFEYDFFQYLLDHTPNPREAFKVFNIVEDFRSESILLETEYAEHYRSIIIESRRYYASAGGFDGELGRKFFSILMGELYCDKLYEEILPEYADQIGEFKAMQVDDVELLTKRISTIGDFLCYALRLIRCMDTSSSRFSILIAVEIFNLLNRVANLEIIDISSAGMEHTPAGEKTLTETGLPQLEDADDGNLKNGEEKGGGENQFSDDGSGEPDDNNSDNETDTNNSPDAEKSEVADLRRKERLSRIYQDLNHNAEAGETCVGEYEGELVDSTTRTLSDNAEAERMINAVERDAPFINPGDVSAQCSEEMQRRKSSGVSGPSKAKRTGQIQCSAITAVSEATPIFVKFRCTTCTAKQKNLMICCSRTVILLNVSVKKLLKLRPAPKEKFRTAK